MEEKKNVLHVVTVSFVINHFFGKQFTYLNSKYGNSYYLSCTPSDDLNVLASHLDFIPLPVEITRNISPIKDLKAIIRIIKFIRKYNIEVVVGHTPKGGLIAMIAAFFAKVDQRIYFRHGIIYETSKGFKKKLLINLERLTGRIAKVVVCVSNEVRNISNIDKLNPSSKNILLGKGTCNGVSALDKYNPDYYSFSDSSKLKKQWGIMPEDRVIGYVGRIVRDKGINELILAWKEIEKKHLNVKLLLVGPIEERDAIHPKTKEDILSCSSIISTGFILNSAPFFSIMDIFILPTYREGFPTVALEASSMGLPVLITKATGCSEAIIENETGVFIDNTVESIINWIDYYLLNPELGENHGRKGREFVLKSFEERLVWEEIHNLLKY